MTQTDAQIDPVPLVFTYRNWRGEVSERRVMPIHIWFGKTKYHPKPQWFLNANDLDKGVTRDFAMKDIGARAMQAAMGGGAVKVPSKEGIARVLSASYGENPDDDAPLTKICGPNNEPLPNWMAYEEQAEAVLAALEPAPPQDARELEVEGFGKLPVLDPIEPGDPRHPLAGITEKQRAECVHKIHEDQATPAPEPGSFDGMTDLKARLLAGHVTKPGLMGGCVTDVGAIEGAMIEAHTAIADLQQQISAQSREIDHAWDEHAKQQARATAAEAERDALREALTEIANAYTAHGYSDAMDAVQTLKDTAKEALK